MVGRGGEGAQAANVGVTPGATSPLPNVESIAPAKKELVAVDVMLAFWVRNRDALDLDDVVSLALGVRIEF